MPSLAHFLYRAKLNAPRQPIEDRKTIESHSIQSHTPIWISSFITQFYRGRNTKLLQITIRFVACTHSTMQCTKPSWLLFRSVHGISSQSQLNSKVTNLLILIGLVRMRSSSRDFVQRFYGSLWEQHRSDGRIVQCNLYQLRHVVMRALTLFVNVAPLNQYNNIHCVHFAARGWWPLSWSIGDASDQYITQPSSVIFIVDRIYIEIYFCIVLCIHNQNLR